MVSINWRSMELEDRVFASTITAFSLSMMTSLVAVTLFTRNITLAFYVCCTILLVVCVLSGCLLILGHNPEGFLNKNIPSTHGCCQGESSETWAKQEQQNQCLRNFLQYDFGVVEAIGATVFVGLSVSSSAKALGKATWKLRFRLCPSGGLLPALGPWKLGWKCSTSYAIHQVWRILKNAFFVFFRGDNDIMIQ